MKIGITGATGQLGRIVVSKLKEKISKETIVALVRTPSKASDLGVEAKEFDYNKAETLVESLKGIDKLLLISGNEIGKRFEQHKAVIDAAVKAGVKHFVYTSLLHADTSSLGLAAEHHATEKAIKESNLTFTIIRNGWYSENYTNSIQGGLAYGAICGSAGDGKISSATREDYAEAAIAVLTSNGHENKTYELAGDNFFTMNDLAEIVSKLSGKKVEYQNLPLNDYASVLVKAGLPEGVAQFLAGADISTSEGALFDDSKQLSKLIGRPSTSIEEFVRTIFK